ncbi:MAG: hypothetical protein ACRDHM_07055 [Actinomycetota bacterium]
MRPFLLLAALLAVTAPAFAQEPSVSYSVTVESPGAVAVGDVALRVRVSGGVREAESAAFHLRTTGGWSEAQSVRLTRVSENVFEDNIDTAALPNDAYRIEVRVWTDVPPYNPNDPRTFTRSIVDMAIDNAPQTPQDLLAQTPATALRVGWDSVDDSDRSDFLGYRVFVFKARSCPPELAVYRQVAELDELTYADESLGAGDYCVRVASARKSVVTDELLSPPSPPVKVSIDRASKTVLEGGGGIVFGGGGSGGGGSIMFERTEKAEPPPVPALGEGDPVISDGEFVEDLPYGPKTVTQAPDGSVSGEEVSLEAGVDPRRTPTLIAGGLILATIAGLLRRFLSAAPRG